MLVSTGPTVTGDHLDQIRTSTADFVHDYMATRENTY